MKKIKEKCHCDLTLQILDGNFSRKQLIKVLNAELANTMGNLLGRCTGKIINPEQKLPSWNEDSLALCSQASRDLMSQVWEVTQRFSVSNFLSRKSIMFNFALVCSRKPQVN